MKSERPSAKDFRRIAFAGCSIALVSLMIIGFKAMSGTPPVMPLSSLDLAVKGKNVTHRDSLCLISPDPCAEAIAQDCPPINDDNECDDWNKETAAAGPYDRFCEEGYPGENCSQEDKPLPCQSVHVQECIPTVGRHCVVGALAWYEDRGEWQECW